MQAQDNISEGLRSLVGGRAGAGVGLQPRRRRGQTGPLHVRVGSRVRQAEEVRDHAKVWRRFLLRKGRGRLRHQWLLRVHARAVHQSLAQPLTITRSSGKRINSNGRTSAERSREAPTQRPLAPRHFATPCSRVGRGWASLPNPTLGTTGCTPPPARLRLWPSAPTGSACPWSPTASVERRWPPGGAVTLPYLTRARLSRCLIWWRTWTAGTV